jgi:hypothetical protein
MLAMKSTDSTDCITKGANGIYFVRTHYDAQTKRWTASSDDIPGLVTEADSFDDLIEQVSAIAPEMMVLNCPDFSGDNFHVVFSNDYSLTIPMKH